MKWQYMSTVEYDWVYCSDAEATLLHLLGYSVRKTVKVGYRKGMIHELTRATA